MLELPFMMPGCKCLSLAANIIGELTDGCRGACGGTNKNSDFIVALNRPVSVDVLLCVPLDLNLVPAIW
jgi:hypothetical protein